MIDNIRMTAGKHSAALAVVIITTANGLYPTFTGRHAKASDNLRLFRSLSTSYGSSRSLDPCNIKLLFQQQINIKSNICRKNTIKTDVKVNPDLTNTVHLPDNMFELIQWMVTSARLIVVCYTFHELQSIGCVGKTDSLRLSGIWHMYDKHV